MAYLGQDIADVAVAVGQGVIDATHIKDASITTADIGNDAVTANKIDDDGTGFQMGSLGLGTAVSGSDKLTVGGNITSTGYAKLTNGLQTATGTERYLVLREGNELNLYSSSGVGDSNRATLHINHTGNGSSVDLADSELVVTKGTGSTFAGTVDATGNITTDGIFKVDSAPDADVIQFDQGGRKSAIKTYFSSSSTGSRVIVKVSNGNTNGGMVDALDIRPAEFIITGDGSDQTTKWHNGSAYVNAKLDVRQLAIAFSGTDKVTSDTSGNFNFSGNIGLGGTALDKLDIHNGNARIRVGGLGLIQLKNDGSNHSLIIANNNGGSETVRFHTSGSSYLTGGNFGVGSSSPQRTFVVSNGGEGGMELGASNTNNIFSVFNRSTSSYLPLQFETSEIAFYTGSGANQLVKINDRANVGIGVAPDATNTNYDCLQVGGNASILSYGTQQAQGEVDFNHNVHYNQAGNYVYQSTDEATRYRQGSGRHIWYSASSGTAGNTISFIERLRIDQNGTIGINVESPEQDAMLHIKKDQSAYTRFLVENNTNSTSTQALGSFKSNAGTLFVGISSTAHSAGGDAIFNQTASGKGMRFFTGGSLAMKITSSQSVESHGGFYSGSATGGYDHGLTTHTNEFNPIVNWQSGQGRVHYNYRANNTHTDWTFYNGSQFGYPDIEAGSFTTTSDYRLKKTVTDFTANVCDSIKELRPVTYFWKSNTKMNTAKQLGFLAHELQEKLPLSVKGEKDAINEKGDIDPQTIKSEALTTYLLKGMQEIIQRLEVLEGN